jgi:putative transcriptional regulator
MSENLFANNLKQIRQAAGLTQSNLAELAEVSRSYINELESGKSKGPSVFVALKLAQALGVSVEWLVLDIQRPSVVVELSQLRRQLAAIKKAVNQDYSV